MPDIDKMPEVKKVAEQIIMAAYKNGGSIEYESIKDLITCDINNVNPILKQYGKISSAMTRGGWISYELDSSGRNFVEKGGFDGIKKREDLQNIIADLSKKNLEFQNNNYEYKKKIRRQESVIRYWKIAEIITAIIAILGWLLLMLL